jgi:hypothetical protein
MVLSAIQQAYNKIADTNLSAFKTEYQNDPDPEEQPETTGLTAGRVASRVSGLDQGNYHTDTEFVTVGLDVGKYYSHWVKIGWHGNAIGNIVDYGVMETPGMMAATNDKAVMTALVPALAQWRTDITADGKLDFCLIDSGDYTEAVYEFVRQVGGTPFAASKGWDQGRFRLPSEGPGKRPFIEAYAAHQPAERLWLYNVNTEHWKQWTQERFVTATFDDQNQFNDGTLSLYASTDRKRHLSFSHHIVAEERRETFVPGRGMIRKWVVLSKNNHYLDAAALACAAAGVLGVRILPKTQTTPVSQQLRQQQPVRRLLNSRGQPFLVTERR